MTKIVLLVGFLALPLFSLCQSYGAELMDQQTHITIKDNKLTKTVAYEIRINNRSGERYARISIPYTKLSKISNIEAYIKNAQGKTVKKLKKSEIHERSLISDFSFYEDNAVKTFTLKHNAYPYTIVYSYKIQQNNYLYIEDWTPVINENIPTLKAELTICVPLHYSFTYKSRQTEKPVIDTLKDIVCYQWHARYTETIKPEVFSPPLSDFLPAVMLVPQKFHYDINGSFKDWTAYGNWQNELLHGLNALPDMEKSKINTLIRDTKGERETIKVLYHYLQDETRYVNISIETGGMKPYPASYVAQNKYGDCKALTNYFKSILDYVHIPSYYTKVYAGSPIKKIDKDFPSQQFNHVILFIPQKGKDIWLDCTSKGPFNHLGTFTQNREALVVQKNNSHFVKTPALKPPDVLNTRTIKVSYGQPDATVKFQNRYRGNLFENILFLEKNYNETEKSKIIRNYMVAKGSQLINYHIAKPNRDSVSVRLTYETSSQKIYRHYGNDILVANIPLPLPGFEKPEKRKLPVQLDYPIFDIDTLEYEIPKGYTLLKPPEDCSIENKYGTFKRTTLIRGNTLVIIKSLLIRSGYYPLKEYAGFYRFYHKVAETEDNLHVTFYK